MADPDAPRFSLTDWARKLGVTGFFAWWGRELAAALPARITAALERRKLRPVVAFDGDRISFWKPSARDEAVGMSETASIAASADATTLAAQGRAALDAIFGASPESSRDVTLALGARQVLHRSLTLPSAVEDNLRAAIGYDLDRLTPFKADDLDFDVVVADRDAQKHTIDVEVVAVRRRTLDQAITLVRSFGGNVAAAVAASPRDAASSRINLIAPDERAGVRGLLRWQLLLPLVVLAALVAAALVAPLWQKRAHAIDLMNAADAASVRARESDRLRSDLERMVGEYNFALERKHATPGVARVLDEITRLLPEDTWLTQFEFKTTVRGKVVERNVFLKGESANAGKLISLLEDATLVSHATPRSPTTKLQPGPGESFDIGVQVKPLALPQTIALASLAAVAPPPAAVAPAPAADARPGAVTPSAAPAGDGDAQPDAPAAPAGGWGAAPAAPAPPSAAAPGAGPGPRQGGPRARADRPTREQRRAARAAGAEAAQGGRAYPGRAGVPANAAPPAQPQPGAAPATAAQPQPNEPDDEDEGS